MPAASDSPPLIPAIAPAAPAPTPAAPDQPTMLVVDDEEGPRLSLRMVFKNDFRVHTVENGELAVEFARHNPVHVCILDIRMAGRSGIEVLRNLKEIDPHMEILMLTAYETIETARQSLRLGACDYLGKPFDLPTIREAVARALRLRRISETVLATQERLHRLMEKQQAISLACNEAFVGRDLKVLIEGAGEGISIGRSYRDAPQVDGLVLVKSEIAAGEMIDVRITGATIYDLDGKVLE